MSALKTTADQPTLLGRATEHDQARALLGQVMGLVAVTVGSAALGVFNIFLLALSLFGGRRA